MALASSSQYISIRWITLPCGKVRYQIFCPSLFGLTSTVVRVHVYLMKFIYYKKKKKNISVMSSTFQVFWSARGKSFTSTSSCIIDIGDCTLNVLGVGSHLSLQILMEAPSLNLYRAPFLITSLAATML